VIKRIVLSTQAQADLAALDRPVALRIVGAINRFAATGAGNVQRIDSIVRCSRPQATTYSTAPQTLSQEV
jgi:hypothetical protein